MIKAPSASRLATACAVLVLTATASAAYAQPAPTTPPAGAPPAAAPGDVPPPPPADAPPPPRADAGPRPGVRPPPPPHGASIVIDHLATGGYHVDVRCAQSDATRDCAAIAMQLLDKLNGAVQAK